MKHIITSILNKLTESAKNVNLIPIDRLYHLFGKLEVKKTFFFKFLNL